MKEIKLRFGGTALVDDEDYEMISSMSWSSIKSRHSKTSYAIHRYWCKTEHRHKCYQMHRLIMSAPVGLHIDHINMNGLDNRRCNLRIVSPSQNVCRSTRKDNKHGYRGVRVGFGKYKVRVRSNGKDYCGGSFVDLQDAARAYDKLALKLHGQFATTNFPRGEYE